MKIIAAESLTADAFAPFGDLIGPPKAAGRDFVDGLLVNSRPVAGRPSLSFARIPAAAARPVPLARVERHEFSTQAFVPLGADFAYLVGVTPMVAGSDAPDFSAMRVFLAAPGQAINYKANVWHLPMQTVGGEGRFAIVMFNDGSAADTEFRDIPEAVAVAV